MELLVIVGITSIIIVMINFLYSDSDTKDCGMWGYVVLDVVYSPFVFDTYESVVKIMFDDGEVMYYNIHREVDVRETICREIKELGRNNIKGYKTRKEALENNMYYCYENENLHNI